MTPAHAPGNSLHERNQAIITRLREDGDRARLPRHQGNEPVVPSTRWLFPVNLTKTSGSAGDNDDPCTFVYTAKSLDDAITYGTGLTPQKQRPAVGAMVSGNGKVGLGYFDADGDFTLYDANEVEDAEECST